jgi:hypothetical protein
VTADERERLVTQLVRHEGLRLGDFSAGDACEERGDFVELHHCCVVLDPVCLGADDYYVAWHVSETRNNAIDCGAGVTHLYSVHNQWNAKGRTYVWDCDVSPGDGDGNAKSFRAVSTELDQVLAVPGLVSRARELSDLAFVLSLRGSAARLVCVVRSAVKGIRARSALRVSARVWMKLDQGLCLLTEATVALAVGA